MFKKEKNHAVDSAAITTLLGRDTIIEGTLTFKETIRVDNSGGTVTPSGPAGEGQ